MDLTERDVAAEFIFSWRRTAAVALVVMTLALTGGCGCAAHRSRLISGVNLVRTSYEPKGLPGVSVSAVHGGTPGGQRVIYIHGTPGAALGWTNFLADPIEGLDSVAIDRPGFGLSQPREALPSLVDQAAAIEPLLVKRDGRWPILVGHSLGGPIATQVAATYPGRVDGLVIVAGALDPGQEHVQLVQRLAELPLAKLLIPRDLRNTNSELLPLKGELEALEHSLKQIRCPIVILHGTRDGLVPYRNVAYMEERLGGDASSVEVVTVPEADHCLPWTNEALIRREILRLAKYGPAQRAR